MWIRAVVLPVALLVVVMGLLWLQVRRLAEAAVAVDRSDMVIAQINEAQRLILDKDRGLRGYLVTSDPRFLAPFRASDPDQAFGRLAQMVDGDSAQTLNVGELHARYETWNREAKAALDDPVHGKDSASMWERKLLTDEMNTDANQLRDYERQLRDVKSGKSEQETRASEVVLGALGAVLALYIASSSKRRVHTIVATIAAEREARQAAEEALRVRESFLAMLSHELRTPLTPILGWAGMLRAKTLSGDALDKALAAIERNAKIELQLVNDLLDTSRIAADKLHLEPEIMDLVDVVKNAVTIVQPAAAAKGVGLLADIVPTSLRMVGDPTRLQQVLWNLLSNAVKFTRSGGLVKVELVLADSVARVRVKDTGEGILPGFLPYVFERFQQADSSTTRAHGGLGLGLAIAKAVVVGHGGQIEVASEGRGMGSTFTVRLPVQAVEPEDAERSSALAPDGQMASTPLLGIRVLVVDDEAGSRDVIAEILREHGADVVVAPSGRRAIELFGRAPVDVVVSDLAMPEMDGYELIRRIQGARKTRDARVASLALSAHAGAEDVARARRAGFEEHLAKPVSPSRLVTMVAELVRRDAPF